MKNINKINHCLLLPIVLFNFSTFSITNTQELIKRINEIIQKYPTINVGIEIYSLSKNEPVFTLNSEKLFTPASNTKLFVETAALYALGSNYQFTTQLLSENKINNGILNNSLYLKPDGDPSFTYKHLENLIKELSELGLKEIRGDIFIINNEFDHECFAPGVTIDDLGTTYCNPINSFIVNHQATAISPVNIVDFTDNKKLENLFFDIDSAIRSLLEQYNIKLSGIINFSQKTPPQNYVLAEHKSQKLALLISHMLKESDNLYADCLFKKIASNKYKAIATWQKSRQCLNEFLYDNLSIEPSAIKIIDGSGLSRYTLISPHQIITLLTWAYHQSNFKDFLESLAIAGVDGTLKNRMTNITANVKAKTGSMDGVSALSGYIETEDDFLAFSIINNGYISTLNPPPCKTEIEDAICKLLTA